MHAPLQKETLAFMKVIALLPLFLAGAFALPASTDQASATQAPSFTAGEPTTTVGDVIVNGRGDLAVESINAAANVISDAAASQAALCDRWIGLRRRKKMCYLCMFTSWSSIAYMYIHF